MDKPFPAYKGDEAYVFICYSHRDETIIFPEILSLHERGLNIWYDEGISAGKVWLAEVAEVITGASKLIFYISKSSLESDHCKREVHYALTKGIEIVPVYLEETELSADLEIALSLIQALHRNTDKAYEHHLHGALGLREVEPHRPGEPTHGFTGKPIPSNSRRRWLALGFICVLAVVAVLAVRLIPPGSEVETDVIGAGSIAVLPFENLSDDLQQGFFSEGISDEIINLLTQVEGLQVVARTSAFLFKDRDMDLRDIGRALGVKTLLTGSVRRSSDQVRISVQLIDAETGFHVWSKIFNRQFGDILTLQSEIAGAVLVSLQGNHQTELVQFDSAPSVYEGYLRARSLLYEETEASLIEAAALLDDMLIKVPGDGRIHAARARAWIMLSEEQYGDVPMSVALRSAQPHVKAALEFAPLVADSHTVLGLSFLFERRFNEAVTAFERAAELAPGDAFPWHWLYFAYNEVGSWAKGREALARAATLDPLYPNTFMHYFFVFNNIRPEAALELMARFEDRWANHPFLLIAGTSIALQSGELAEALRLDSMYCERVGYQRTLCGQFLVDLYYMLGLTDELRSVGMHKIEPPLLDAFMCPVDSLRPIDSLAAFRLTRFNEALDGWNAAFNDDIDHTNGAVYAASISRWDDVRTLLEPLAVSRETTLANLVSMHPIHVRFYIADLALARKKTGDEAGTEAMLVLLEELAIEVASMQQSQLVPEHFVHLLDMSIAAVKGDETRAFASYERAFDMGYRFRSPVNDPLLLQWRDTQIFERVQSRYEAAVDREREIVMERGAGPPPFDF